MPFELTEQISRHLTEDKVGWLTTVTPSGKPAPRPIWFLWDGTAATIYSLNNSAKLRHIEANEHVTLHFGGADGNDVVVISGRAEIVPDAPVPSQVPALLAKYERLVQKMGLAMNQPTDWWDKNYSTAIRVTPERVWTIGG
jgi:PPOX class probable F420-dependent enzyme